MVRGQSGTAVDAAAPGRQWLTAQFQAAGAVVDFVVVYQRRVPHFSAEQLKRMQDSRHDGSVWLFSSAEGLDSLPRLPQGDWSTARAIATHPRIAGAASASDDSDKTRRATLGGAPACPRRLQSRAIACILGGRREGAPRRRESLELQRGAQEGCVRGDRGDSPETPLASRDYSA
jgi:hypothetical protein